jgi:hypothetical protein
MSNTSIYTTKNSNTKEFITKSQEIYGNFYNYSEVIYIKARLKVIIICPKHGKYNQTPCNHLSGHSCPKCAIEKQIIKQSSNREKVVSKFIETHKEKYNYSLVEYINSMTKVIIICPIHGEFEQTPNNHLRGKGCPKCANNKISNSEEFTTKANKIHNKRYDYSKVEYSNAQSKIIIMCHIHGEFSQTANSHLAGHGCPKCSGENTRKLNSIKFKDKFNFGILYLIRCFNDKETFLKIGITSKDIDSRYKSKISLPYNRETLYEKYARSEDIINMENKIKYLFKYHKPEIMFKGGRTETLHISQEKAVLEFLNFNF